MGHCHRQRASDEGCIGTRMLFAPGRTTSFTFSTTQNTKTPQHDEAALVHAWRPKGVGTNLPKAARRNTSLVAGLYLALNSRIPVLIRIPALPIRLISGPRPKRPLNQSWKNDCTSAYNCRLPLEKVTRILLVCWRSNLLPVVRNCFPIYLALGRLARTVLARPNRPEIRIVRFRPMMLR